MSQSERPTTPPTAADDFALEFSLAVARKDAALRRRGTPSSGLLFALALAEEIHSDRSTEE
jgi:hypothetical protein